MSLTVYLQDVRIPLVAQAETFFCIHVVGMSSVSVIPLTIRPICCHPGALSRSSGTPPHLIAHLMTLPPVQVHLSNLSFSYSLGVEKSTVPIGLPRPHPCSPSKAVIGLCSLCDALLSGAFNVVINTTLYGYVIILFNTYVYICYQCLNVVVDCQRVNGITSDIQ